jgi:hypothetical protein
MSSMDLERAVETDWVYLVVGLEGEPEIRAWSLGRHDVHEIDLSA